MRFYWNNYIDSATTVITSSSENTDLPDDNVADSRKGKVWRTGTSTAAEWIKFDLGSALDVDGFIVFNHTLDENDSAINIEGHTADSWGTPDVTAAISISDENETGAQKWSSAQSKRWWRFEFTKQASGDAIDIGRLFLGDVYDTTEAPDSDGYSDETVDLSTQQRSIDGQTYDYIKNEYQKLRVKFTACSLAQAKQLKTIYDAVGTHTPFFVQIDQSASDGIREVIHYVKFTNPLKRNVHSYDGELKWNLTLNLESQL